MILDDLLIYGDWLEENDIKNDLYKSFLNLLKIRLRRNNQYYYLNFCEYLISNGFGYGCGWCLIGGHFGFSNGDGRGFGTNYMDGYDGNGHNRDNNEFYGDGSGCGFYYGYGNYNGCSEIKEFLVLGNGHSI